MARSSSRVKLLVVSSVFPAVTGEQAKRLRLLAHPSLLCLVPPAKKMMSLVSGRGVGGSPGDGRQLPSSPSSSSLSLRAKKSKRKLYRPEISSPMDVPPHPVRETEHACAHKLSRARALSRLHVCTVADHQQGAGGEEGE